MYGDFQGGERPEAASEAVGRAKPEVIGDITLWTELMRSTSDRASILAFVNAVFDYFGASLSAIGGCSDAVLSAPQSSGLFSVFCADAGIAFTPRPYAGAAQCTVQFIVETSNPLKLARRFDELAKSAEPPCGVGSRVQYHKR
jgi:hypothetical protein